MHEDELTDSDAVAVRVGLNPSAAGCWVYDLIDGQRSNRGCGHRHPYPDGGLIRSADDAVAAGRARAESLGLRADACEVPQP